MKIQNEEVIGKRNINDIALREIHRSEDHPLTIKEIFVYYVRPDNKICQRQSFDVLRLLHKV